MAWANFEFIAGSLPRPRPGEYEPSAVAERLLLGLAAGAAQEAAEGAADAGLRGVLRGPGAGARQAGVREERAARRVGAEGVVGLGERVPADTVAAGADRAGRRRQVGD